MPEGVFAEEGQIVRWTEDQPDPAPHLAAFVVLGPRERRELVADHRAVPVHAHESGDIRRGPEESRVSGHAAHRVGVLVVDLAAKPLMPPLAVLFRGGAFLAWPWPEIRSLGFDDTEDPLVHEVAEGSLTCSGETGGEHDVTEIAVAELANVLRQRLLRGEPDELLWRLGLFPERLPPGEARGVGEHLQERHPVLRPASKVRQQLAKRHVQREGPVAHERKDERGRRELRERREIEQRCGRAWRVRSGTRIRTERARRVCVDRAAALDAHHRRGAERADRRVDDRPRALGRGRRAQVTSSMALGRRTGRRPLALRSPARTAARASRDTGTSA